MFNVCVSHQNKHQDGQDVKDSITKQRPPAQRDWLEKADTNTHCKYNVEADQANKDNHSLGQKFCVLYWQQMTHSMPYLSGEDATEADDDQDVKDGRSHNSSHTHISFCDEHP